MTDKKQQADQDSLREKKKKSREREDWVEQAGKNPDDMEIFTKTKRH